MWQKRWVIIEITFFMLIFIKFSRKVTWISLIFKTSVDVLETQFIFGIIEHRHSFSPGGSISWTQIAKHNVGMIHFSDHVNIFNCLNNVWFKKTDTHLLLYMCIRFFESDYLYTIKTKNKRLHAIIAWNENAKWTMVNLVISWNPNFETDFSFAYLYCIDQCG